MVYILLSIDVNFSPIIVINLDSIFVNFVSNITWNDLISSSLLSSGFWTFTSILCFPGSWISQSHVLQMKYRLLHLLKICFNLGTGMSLQSSQTFLEHRLHLIKSTSLLLDSENSHLLMSTLFELPSVFLGFDQKN